MLRLALVVFGLGAPFAALAQNTPPTITSPGNVIVSRGASTGPRAFTIGDVQDAASALTLVGASSDPALVPAANISFGGSGANRTVTISPVGGVSGVTTITLTVSDTGTPALTASTTFEMTVNDPPTLSAIGNRTIDEDALAGPIAFTVDDTETPAAQLNVAATSSSTNPNLLPSGSLVLGGAGGNRSITITPAANENGSATITVTVTDQAGRTDTESFTLTVRAVNDAPTLAGDLLGTALAPVLDTESNVLLFSGITLDDVDQGRPSNESLTVTITQDATSLGLGTFENLDSGNIVLTGTPSSVTTQIRALRFHPTPNRAPVDQSATFSVTLGVQDANGATASNNGTVRTVHVRSANDAPLIAGSLVPGSVPDAGDVAPFRLTIADPDPLDDSLPFTVALEPVSDPGFTYGSLVPAVPSFSGNLADALFWVRGILFRPAPNSVAASQAITFRFRVTDVHGAASTNDVTLTLTGRNDSPEILGVAANVLRLTDDPGQSGFRPFQQARIVDPDANGNQSQTVTLSVVDPSLGSLSSTLLTGIPSDVTTQLRAVVFTPALRPGRTLGETVNTTLRIRVVDDLNAEAVDTKTILAITSVDGAPVIAGLPSTQPLSLSPVAPVHPFAALSVTDDVDADVTFTIQIDTPAKGVLTNLVGTGGRFSEEPSGSGRYRMVATPGEISEVLSNIVFTVNAEYVFAPSLPGGTTFRLEAVDAALNTRAVELSVVLENAPRNHLVTDDTDEVYPEDHLPIEERGRPRLGTLRRAIAEAGNNDVITFDFPSYPALIRLDSVLGPLELRRNVTLKGPGADLLTVSGDSRGDRNPGTQTRILRVLARATIEGLTLADGYAVAGGAVSVGASGDLRMRYCSVVDSRATQWGGAIDVDGGRIDLANCLFRDNRTDPALGLGGGAISIFSSLDSAILNSTFSRNRQAAANGFGGGALYVELDDPSHFIEVTVENCTFAENQDAADRGSSIVANVLNTVVRLKNSVFADNRGRNLGVQGTGQILSDGGNVSDDSTRAILTQSGVPKAIILLDRPTDMAPGQPLLGAFDAKRFKPVGGYPLLAGSAAVGRAVAPAPAVDQRGAVRDSAPDAGAFELGAAARVVLNEIQHTGSPADFLEFYVLRDSVPIDLSHHSVWVDGTNRHVFPAGTFLRPGAGVIVSDDGSLPALGGTLVQAPTGGVGSTLELGSRGLVELRTPGTGGRLLASTRYVGVYADPATPALDLNTGNRSITLKPQFLGFAMVPHPIDPQSPGSDSDGTPFGSSNAYPSAVEDEFVVGEDDIAFIPVLDNDADSDGSDQLVIIDVTPLAGSFGNNPTNSTALLAGVSVDPANTPPSGSGLVYNPRVSALLQSLPEGFERTDEFYYSVVDVGSGAITAFQADPLTPTNLIVVSANHRLVTGQSVELTGSEESTYRNVVRAVSVLDEDRFSVGVGFAGDPAEKGTWHTVLSLVGGGIASYSGSSGTSPVTVTSADHGLNDNEAIVISGAGVASYNGQHVVTRVNADQFVIPVVFAGDAAVRGSWSATRSRIPTRPSQGLVRLTVIGANDPPSPGADIVPGEEETILRLFGDGVIPALSSPPVMDTDDAYAMIPVISPISLLANDIDVDTDDDASTLQIVGVLSRVFSVLAYDGVENEIGVAVTSPGHGLATGDVLLISGYGGHPSYNGFHLVTVIDSDTFSIPVVYVDNAPAKGQWGILTDANRLNAVSEHGATVQLEIRVDRIETSIVYNPLTSEYLNGLAAGETEPDAFFYAVADSHGAVSFASVTILVDGRNDAPQPGIDPPSLADLPPGTSVEELLSGGTVNFYLPPSSQTPQRMDVEVTVGTPPAQTTVFLTDLWTTDEDTALVIEGADLVANDQDVDRLDIAQSRLRVKALVSGTSRLGASLALDAGAGRIHFNPSPALNNLAREEAVLDTFEVLITDDRGSDVPALVAVLVVGVNDRPIANSDQATTPEDTQVTILPLANDTDPDVNGSAPDNQLRILPVAPTVSAKGALVTLTPESLLYDPSVSEYYNRFVAGYEETEIVPYTAADGSFIFANDDLFKVQADGSTFELALLANDSNLSGSGGAIRIVSVGTPNRGGSVALNAAADGVVYTPQVNFVGDEVFPYAISDENGNTDRGFVVVKATVNQLNGNLQANDDAYSVALGEESVLDVLANDNILPSSSVGLTITRIVSQPAQDRVELSNNQITYFQTSPAAGYSVSFQYEIEGGGIARAIATVQVRVVDRRDTLAVRPDSFGVQADSAAEPLDVLANDDILPGSPVVLTVARITTAPTHGTVTLADDGRRVLYRPDAGYVGLDSFWYEATDGFGGTGSTEVSLSIGALTTRGDFFAVPFDDPASADHALETPLDVLANDRVLQAAPLNLEIVSVSPASTALGTLRVAGDKKSLLFDPAVGQEGEAAFVYSIRDGASGGRTANGSLTVVVVREGVRANADFFSVEVGSTENLLPVLANDVAIPDRGRRLTVVSLGTGLNAPNRGGAVRVSDSGDGLIYTPAAGFAGEEVFTYTMTDSRSTDTVKVVVQVASGALSANSDAYTVYFARSTSGDPIAFSLPVLVNDRVLPNAGQVLRITGVGINDTVNEPNAPDKQGEVAISADGTALIYSPRQTTGFTYHESFTYEITDGTDRRSQGRVEVEVQLRDDVRDMETHDDAFTVERDSQGKVLRVLANDNVRPASALGWRITGVSPTAFGGVVSVRGSDLLYTPSPGFVGTDTFTYFVSDGIGGTGSALVQVKVGDLPLCPDVFSVLSDSVSNALDVLVNDAIRPELPGGSFHLVGIGTPPSRGTASVADSVVLYTPTGGGPYPYTDTLIYEVADDSGLIVSAKATILVFETGSDRDSAEVTITVVGVNDAPIITGTRCCFDVYQRGSILPFAGVTFTEYDDLPAPEILTLQIQVSDPTHGYLTDASGLSLDPDGDGRYTFTGTDDTLTAIIRSLVFVPTTGDPSRLTAGGSEETRLTLQLSDPYVTVVDATTTLITRHPEIQRLQASDGSSADEFGFSVGASRRTVSAGAPFDDDSLIQGSGNKTGSAYLYERNAPTENAWGQVAKVFPAARAIGDEFGYATDVDASGTVLVAGARRATTGSATTGAAYIFRRTADGLGGWLWTETARLPAPGLTSGNLFGYDVALNAAGDLAVVGAPQHQPAGLARTGAAFVFARTSVSPEAWTWVTTLKPPTGANDDEFGRSVSVHGDLIAVGAPRFTPTNKKSGVTYLFRRNPAGTGAWSFLVRITPAAGDNGDEFGHSVAVHGEWLAVGARLDEANGKKSGTTYVFRQNALNPASWSQTAMLQSGAAGIDDEYGYSVALDSEFLVVGARREATAGRRAGAIHVHGRDVGGAGAWGRLERLIPSSVDQDDEFGFSLAIRQGLAAVGARRQQLDGRRMGSTYVYQLRFNNAPLVRGELPAATAYIETPFAYQVPTDIFVDPDVGDTIVGYEAFLADGQPLPGWLAFDGATATFSSSGGPTPLDVGVLNVRVDALDQDGTATSASFELQVDVASAFLANAVTNPSLALAWSLEHADGLRIPPASASLQWLGPDQDPDGDGITNVEEYARASNPFLADDSGEAGSLMIENDGSGQWVLRVRRRTDDPRLSYRLESSDDLQTWTALKTAESGAPRRITHRIDDASVRVPHSVGQAVRFFRVRMSYQ